MKTKFKKNDIVNEAVDPTSKQVGRSYYSRLPENHRRQFVFQEQKLIAAVPKPVDQVPV